MQMEAFHMFRRISVVAACSITIGVPLLFSESLLNDALKAQRDAVSRLAVAIESAPQQVQAQISQVPTITNPELQPKKATDNTTKQVVMATPGQRKELFDQTNTFKNRMARSRDLYDRAATLLVGAGIVGALLASLAAFLRWNVTSGILGLVVTAVIGIPSVYPVNTIATFYRSLAAQSAGLSVDCSLKPEMTKEEFDSNGKQLKYLIISEGTNFPADRSSKNFSDDLAKELQLLKNRPTLNATP
jgi:hypothetical protein